MVYNPHETPFTTEPAPRRPVTVLQTPAGAHVIYCDDGSIWHREAIAGRFVEALPPLPGSRREAELQHLRTTSGSMRAIPAVG